MQALSCGDCDTNERGDGKSTEEKMDSGCSPRVISLYIVIMMKWQQLAQQRSKVICAPERKGSKGVVHFTKNLILNLQHLHLPQ